MGRHSTKLTSPTPKVDEPINPKKRKINGDEIVAPELAVDISAPEPPSKKALRRAKRGSVLSKKLTEDHAGDEVHETNDKVSRQHGDAKVKTDSSNESNFGIWIGNLPWTTTNADLRTFFTERLSIEAIAIKRLHLPPPKKGSSHTTQQTMKPRNRGFAYVDFSSQGVLDAALALSEELLSGRRILIKDSKNFEGRPEPPKEGERDVRTPLGNPPSQRIFVGNLGFDTTKEDLLEHFSQCGAIADLHVATFEDTGKCKGYAWIEYVDLEGGKVAARGWVERESDPAEDAEQDSADKDASVSKQGKQKKAHKWWINRLQGRDLRLEFAEDKTLRYKKRFNKDRGGHTNSDHDISDAKQQVDAGLKPNNSAKDDKPPSTRRPLQKIDPRNVAPGAALAAAPRSNAAIVESRGKRIVFD
ncbi:uncharacterized protein KY384_006118 [Bacidia gigantensis]|uniref:uncharacterized protein n=1 Tax=Bacidia gigantensis TaxID=2732470 RepID=UPI001D03F2C0|nr:uncharacterized protein KY384_006118 [Bacidia gigantensis]KAG8529481.1 hypothetical protein KY384_006118 [Bacidia gigantensis]